MTHECNVCKKRFDDKDGTAIPKIVFTLYNEGCLYDSAPHEFVLCGSCRNKLYNILKNGKLKEMNNDL